VSTLPLTPSQLNYAESEQWKQIVKQALVNARVATPAFLTEDLGADQTVTVQIAIQERVRVLGAAPQWWDVPPIIKVPIVTPRGGGFSLTLPLKKGDEGLLVFCDTCFDYWWGYGQQNAPVAQNLTAKGLTQPSGSQRQLEVRRHHVHDCGFIPGMWSQPHVLSNYSASSLQLRSDDGLTVIDLASGTVTVTGTNVNVVASHANVNASGGTPQFLVTHAFYNYWVTNILPFLQGLGYVGPTPPGNSETTVLKGQ
jgi:hypothetical protein